MLALIRSTTDNIIARYVMSYTYSDRFEKELARVKKMAEILPDKGEKYTFGYDTDYFPDLLSNEGSDNSPLLTMIRVPRTTDSGRLVYDEDTEA